MSPEIENLIALERTEQEIQRLRQEIAELPKRVAGIEQTLAGTRAALEGARTGLKADEAGRRKHETAIVDLRQKISKYRDQSLEVKTNEQYRALLHEIQFTERQIADFEDRVLELMVSADGREKEIKVAEADLKLQTAEVEKEKAAARERTAQDERELVEWNARRETGRSAIDADLLRHYDRVRKFRGSGLAEVRDRKCTGCSVVLRPQIENDVRSGKLAYCDSCQRILYFDPSKEIPAEPAPEKPSRRRPRPKLDASQAWYYREEYGQEGEVFVSFANVDGMASRRIYDAATGRKLGDTLVREGGYRQAFPEDLTNAIRLNGSWSDSEQDEWEGELPSTVLDVLHRDLDLARAEMAVRERQEQAAPSTVAS
ncbi:MAG: hypothetical protein JO159_01110 [Acidobacteria bacterium]|nr:hypothetical protein [Acidobacteriota bacterium]MBV9625436.1 hypothetical protein [Acidobacteriota bacterium]